MDRLILSRRSGKNVLGAGAAAILSPPLAFGRPQGPNAGAPAHTIIRVRPAQLLPP
jgi:hypothetical protein